MPDTVAITAGTGTTISTNEETIGGASQHVQRVKTDGATASADGQTTISNTSAAIVTARDTRHAVTIVNRQTVAVWVDTGGGTATTTTSFRLDPGDSLTTRSKTAITAITAAAYSAAGDAKVHYFEDYDS